MDHRGGGRHRIGRWLPHQDALENWLEGLVETSGARRGGVEAPSGQSRNSASSSTAIRSSACLIAQMIEQVPHTKPYTRRHLEGIDRTPLLIDEVIRLGARI